MRKLLPIALGSLVLFGFGCGSSKSLAVNSADQFANLPPLNLDGRPPSDTNSQTDKPAPMEKNWTFPGVLPTGEIHRKQVRMQTVKGEIVFDLLDGDAPKTVSNFVALAKGGYYDGLTFHRRVDGFMIQGGDPNGNGTGGPGYKFEDEPVKRKYDRGIVAMANAGPDTNGSQFFIMLADYPLPPQYTIFGKVTSGQETVDQIAIGDAMTKVTVEDKK